MRAISPQVVLAWMAFGYVLLRAMRYLLGARVYLTCALSGVRAWTVSRAQIDSGELRLLALCDDELIAAGFRHQGFLQVTPFLTYYDGPVPLSLFVNEQLPAHALVRRAMAPEYGRLVEIEIVTELGERGQVVTLNIPYASTFIPPRMRLESYPGAAVAELVERHAARLTTEPRSVESHADAELLVKHLETDVNEVRSLYRARKWVIPTTDPSLDRFTLRGAFGLTRYSQRVFGGQLPKKDLSVSQDHSTPAPIPFEEQRALRIEADLHDALHVAEFPQAPPGTPWALLTVIAVTALLSFVAMAWLFDGRFAALILAAVTLHESGHALAMRALGYRDVHVFFVPLLGAMTIGRPVATSVRNRLIILLAGPVPGLWLGVVLLAIDQVYGPERWLRMPALILLILNGLNLLPFTPLDGGRALEALARPESIVRLVVHAASAAGLLALAAFMSDPIVAALGLFWVALLPRQLTSYRLRRAVAAEVADRSDFRRVVLTTLDVLASSPRYARLRAAARQATARAIGRVFSESAATPGDRAWGAVAYAAAWIPVIVAILLWYDRP
jgi:Zn-dependent protease